MITSDVVTIPMRIAKSHLQLNANVVEMRTVPMSVEVSSVAFNATVGSNGETLGASIGAAYMMGNAVLYDGAYEVTPKALIDQTLETAQKLMERDVTVFKVPYYQTSNEHGDTVYIASEAN